MMLQAFFLFIPITTAQVPCLVEKRLNLEAREEVAFGTLSPDGWLGTAHQNNIKVFNPFEPNYGSFEPKRKLFFLDLRSITSLEEKADSLEAFRLRTFTFGKNHDILYLINYYGYVYKWHSSGLKTELVFKNPGKLVDRLFVSSEANLLVTDHNNGNIVFWDLANKKEVFNFSIYLSAIAFSPDGKLVVLGSSEKIIVLNVDSFKEVWSKDKFPSLWRVGFSPDGKFLIVCQNRWEEGIIHFLNPTDGKTLREPIRLKSGRHPQPYRIEVRFSVFPTAKISPDGLFLACSYDSREVQLWEFATMRKAYSFAGNWEEVRDIVFTHPRRLITRSRYADICLWDLSRHPANPHLAWDDLMSWEPMTGVAATEYYLANPKEFIKTIGDKQLMPVRPTKKRIQGLLQDVVSPAYLTRNKAQTELLSYGELVEDSLRKFIEKEENLEARIVLNDVLSRVKKVDGLGPYDHRLLRVIFILEKIGTLECLPILERVERETSHPKVKSRAREAISRLNRKKDKG